MRLVFLAGCSLIFAFTLNGCEEGAPLHADDACLGRTETQCVVPCQKVQAYAENSGFDYIECGDNENGGSSTITCARPPDGSAARVFPSTLIPRGWDEISCELDACGDASVNPLSAMMSESTGALPCCTLEDCGTDDPDLVCFLGHCVNEPPGPCQAGTCNEGKGCAQDLQEHCDGCSEDSGCVQGPVCELLNGEACLLGPVAMDGQTPVDAHIDSGAVSNACAEAVEVGLSGNPVRATLGCQEPHFVPDECSDSFGLDRPLCSWGGDEPVSPEELPCGSCDDEGYRCSGGVWAACDCDPNGSGEITLDPNYWDEWGCMCVNGTWQCWIIAPSGASCSSCADYDAGP